MKKVYHIFFALCLIFLYSEMINEVAIAITQNEANEMFKKISNYYKTGNYSEAAKLTDNILILLEIPLKRKTLNVANILNTFAEIYRLNGNFVKSESLYKKAISIQLESGGKGNIEYAKILNNLATLYSTKGDIEKAEPLYKSAMVVVKNVKGEDHLEYAVSIQNLASVYLSLGETEEAEFFFKKALHILEKQTDNNAAFYVANIYNSLGYQHYNTGKFSEALKYFRKALELRKNIYGESHPFTAATLNNIASVYKSIGDFQSAINIYHNVISSFDFTIGKDHSDYATSLNNLAVIYHQFIKDYDRAEEYYMKCIKIKEKHYSNKHDDVIRIYENLGALYLESGKLKEAMEIFKSTNSKLGMGRYYLAIHNYDKARKIYISLIESTRHYYKNYSAIIGAYIGIALSYEGQSNYKLAKKYFNSAIEDIEYQWNLLDSSFRRTFLLGKVDGGFSRIEAYEGIIRSIIKEKENGFEYEALKYAEMVKSRTLIQLLSSIKIAGRTIVDKNIFLQNKKYEQRITILRNKINALSKFDKEAEQSEIEHIYRELEKTLIDYEAFINEVKLNDSEITSLISVNTPPIKKIQSLIGPSSTVIEYFITKNKLYMWVITKSEIALIETNTSKQSLLSLSNRILNYSSSYFSNRDIKIVETNSPILLIASNNEIDRENKPGYREIANDIYNLLIAPTEGYIKTTNLIIVPYSFLHKIPFSALYNGSNFLIDKYNISTIPSLSTMFYLINKRNPNSKRFIGFSNPTTEHEPLLYADIEVLNISRLFNNKRIYTKSEAIERRAKVETKDYDIIHFASHGFFNDKQPMQSGLLLCKDSGNDGYLQVHEIFNLNLANANLVTMSACSTALSKIDSGDDLVGLSRAFFYAGSPSIIATLWEIEDESTSILMNEFYRNWIIKGMKKSQALSTSQRKLKSIPKFNHPMFWAPFTLIGDWE